MVGLLAQATGIGLHDVLGASKSIKPQAMQEFVDLVRNEDGVKALTRAFEVSRAYHDSYDPETVERLGDLSRSVGDSLGRAQRELAELNQSLTFEKRGGVAPGMRHVGHPSSPAYQKRRARQALDAVVDDIGLLLANWVDAPPHPELDPTTARRFAEDMKSDLEHVAGGLDLAASAAAVVMTRGLSLAIAPTLEVASLVVGARADAQQAIAEEAAGLVGQIRQRLKPGEAVSVDDLKAVMAENPDWYRRALKGTVGNILQRLANLGGKAMGEVLRYLGAQKGGGKRAAEELFDKAVSGALEIDGSGQ
ncbi:hypothetical protein [Roseospirillum parvum]|uniref:hypothetical protein n=1 Tax=Roseospirillum parvum TaxID=83401 RepID=UPI000B826DE7|nr:hypothetical protein [Roseospirillum parvum]